MFLSDKLIEIGRKSNKRNNMSMAMAEREMINLCKDEMMKGLTANQVDQSFQYATKQLVKEGFTFFQK